MIEVKYPEDERRQHHNVDPDLYDQEVRDAVTFARSLISPRTDPFNLYVKEIASTPLLSRDDEISLGMLIEEGRKEIYSGIARSKSALAAIMSHAGEIESGQLSLRSMVEIDVPEDEDGVIHCSAMRRSTFEERRRNAQILLKVRCKTVHHASCFQE